MMKADRVPAGHDVKSDDAAQRVRYDGHFSVFLKVWIPRAEERIEAVQFLSQTPGDLQTHKKTLYTFELETHIEKVLNLDTTDVLNLSFTWFD